MTALAWVVGRGGLLGSNVAVALRQASSFGNWEPTGGPLPWTDRARLEVRLEAAVHDFLAAAAHHGTGCVFWCAGAGVVGTSPAELAAESSTWELFLALLASELSATRRPHRPLERVFLASSAGGVYAGNTESPLTEAAATRPLSAYGEAKLRQEQTLARWAERHPEVSTLVARISNLYGPGQKGDKPQGLVSQMSRCLIHHRPVHIYVSLDTIRDYVFAEDAARVLVRWMERLREESARAGRGVHILKICASERATTIAGLVGVFRRLAKRQLRIVAGLHPVSGQHPRRLQFRSSVWTDEPRPDATGLLAGIARVYQHQLALYRAAALPPPEPPPRADWQAPAAPYPPLS